MTSNISDQEVTEALQTLIKDWEKWAFSVGEDERNYDLCDFIEQLNKIMEGSHDLCR